MKLKINNNILYNRVFDKSTFDVQVLSKMFHINLSNNPYSENGNQKKNMDIVNFKYYTYLRVAFFIFYNNFIIIKYMIIILRL